jgi:hypothetical protein
MGWKLAELIATTTRARAPSDWLTGELFSYTELKRRTFFDSSSMVKQVLARHSTIFAWHFSPDIEHTYHYFFDILSYHIICQKTDIISFISYREKNDMIKYHISFSYHFKKKIEVS